MRAGSPSVRCFSWNHNETFHPHQNNSKTTAKQHPVSALLQPQRSNNEICHGSNLPADCRFGRQSRCLKNTTLPLMPAVFSKHMERLPFEEICSSRRRSGEPMIVRLPVSVVHGVVPPKRLTPPELSWSSYSAKEGIREPELARILLKSVDPLSSVTGGDPLHTLSSAGHDRASMTYWILEEHVHAFKRVLNHSTAELRGICDNMSMDKKWLVKASACIAAFKKTVAIERGKGRSLFCWFCREPVSKGKVCGGCRSARYCSDRCQKNDWKTHRHMCTGYSPAQNDRNNEQQEQQESRRNNKSRPVPEGW